MRAQKALLGYAIQRKKIPEGFTIELFTGEYQKIASEILRGNYDVVALSEKFKYSLIAEIVTEGLGVSFPEEVMRILREDRLKDKIKELLNTDPTDTKVAIEQIAQKLNELENFRSRNVEFLSFTSVLGLGYDALMQTRPENIISFGYNFLDDRLTGIFPSELVVIGGESGSGKTTFATNIIYKASKKHKCTVFALEDRLHDYGIKALYFEIGKIRRKKGLENYTWNEFRSGKRNENQDEYGQAHENLKNDNIEFAKVDTQLDIDKLEFLIQERMKNGTKLFLIDHLHYFDLTKEPKMSKADYIEKFMVRLKTIQNKTGASIILIVHYKKLDGKKPTLDSFKDSISIIQNASYVISLWRNREDDFNRYETTFFIPKSRNPNGEGTIRVQFDPQTNDYSTNDNWTLSPKIEKPSVI
ncbi:MAG: hypothetical protein EOM19_08035 [Candidatus Moranbacteria bacterium]|nr:hypothetical protein [Candidatus Moranbacteria bacterium]